MDRAPLFTCLRFIIIFLQTINQTQTTHRLKTQEAFDLTFKEAIFRMTSHWTSIWEVK